MGNGQLMNFLRVLLFSAFTPFLVVFTHSIASHSHQDVELLNQVVQALEAGKSISAATNKLYEICKAFLRFAIAFVGSKQNCFGSYDQEDDSFTFPVIPTNSVGPQADSVNTFDLLDPFGGMNGDLVPMSAFLGSCLGDTQAMSGFWNMDFSQTGQF